MITENEIMEILDIELESNDFETFISGKQNATKIILDKIKEDCNNCEIKKQLDKRGIIY